VEKPTDEQLARELAETATALAKVSWPAHQMEVQYNKAHTLAYLSHTYALLAILDKLKK